MVIRDLQRLFPSGDITKGRVFMSAQTKNACWTTPFDNMLQVTGPPVSGMFYHATPS